MHFGPLTALTSTDLDEIVKLQALLRNREVNRDDIELAVRMTLDSHTQKIITARDDNESIVAILIVNLLNKLEKIEARIDEVIVGESARGQGVGRQLMEAAHKWAWDNNADSIELTSRKSREAANALYKKLGYELRNTNVYRLKKPS